MSAVEPIKLFQSVDEVLDYAFRAEAARINPEMSFEIISVSTNPDSLTQEEFIADGIMMKNRAMRSLDILGRHTIAMHYRRPVDSHLQGLVDYSIYVLAFYISKEKPRLQNPFFLADIIRDWAPYGRPHHTLDWWADHTGIPLGTLKSWACSRDPARKSIKFLLDDWLATARAKLDPVYTSAGIL